MDTERIRRTRSAEAPGPFKQFSLSALKACKAQWRDQVFDDLAKLTPAAFAVAYCLANFVTMPKSKKKFMKSGRLIVWPPQDVIREQLHDALALSTISLAISQLRRRGHLTVKTGNQHTGSSEYELILKPSNRRSNSRDNG